MRRNRLAITLVELLVVIVILVLLVALMLPAVRSAREPARRNACKNNLKQIALALRLYEEVNGTLPPAYTVDADGNRLHSWRTLILPYMEQAQLFESIDLTKPWDDPANAKARDEVVDVYTCPSATHEEALTTYLGVFGPACVFSGSLPRKLSEVTDDISATIMVIEVKADPAVHWMSPQDINEDEVLEAFAESRTNHPSVIQAAFVDGSAHALTVSLDEDIVRAMLTISGGEATDFD
jgi:type II secretory pathway pseudopilin PulG